MNVPSAPRSPLDRAALERVLARAAELQTQGAGADVEGALSEDQILDLGKEVGLAPDAIRQALAEERGRVVVPKAAGLSGGWFGSPSLSASRIVPGAPASVLAAVDTALREELSFDVKRRFPDRIVWEPRRTFFDSMRQQFLRPGEATQLRLADEVGASVSAVDAQRTHVQVDAQLSALRTRDMTISAVLAGGGATGAVFFSIAGVAALINFPLVAAITALGLTAVRRNYRSEAMRVAIALEQVLDRLEFGPARPRPRGLVDRLLG